MIPRSLRPASALLAAVLSVGVLPAPARTQEALRLHVTVDKSNVVTLPGEHFTKVSIANPNTADVIVISPTQILINGKAPGATSLLVFYPRKIQYFDLIVQPAPRGAVSAPAPASETHPVLIQRGDKFTSQMFVRDGEHDWLELGAPRGESEAGKK
jgi:Pilus formation protein N terminal region